MLERQLIASLIKLRADIPNDMEFGGRVRFLIGRYLNKLTAVDVEDGGGTSE